MSTNPYLCKANGSQESDTLHDIEVAGYRYVMLPICIFGVVCNLLNLSVLLQRRLKESPYTYLTGLALADMLTLIFISSLSIVRGDFIRHESRFFTLIRHQTQIYMPLANYFGQVSVMITVALTVERYLFTTYPLHTRSFCKPSYARMVIAIILIIWALINIPRFRAESVDKIIGPQDSFNSLTCTTHPFVIESSSTNASHVGQCFCVVVLTGERFARVKNYYFPTIFVVNQILPFIILLGLNLSLIRRVQIANRCTLAELVARQQNNLNTATPTSNTAKQKRLRDEHRLTKTLVSIVLVFLVCNTFTIISYPELIRWLTATRHPKYLSKGFRIQKLITNIMLLLNYSINFFFYCAFNEKFLETLKNTFAYERLCCKWKSSPHRTLSTNSTLTLHSKFCKNNRAIANSHPNVKQMNKRRQQFSNEHNL